MCALMTVSKTVRKFIEQRIVQHDLPAAWSGPRMGVLVQVHKRGTLRMGDLAAHLGVAARTITDMVDGLERDGLLVRRPDPADGRATLLQLTPAARADFQRVFAARISFLKQIFSPLGANQRRQLLRLLTKLERGPITACRND
jgi:DNA-binding MarR family transcriptional regulator